MTRHSLAFRQLAALTAVHFMVDMLFPALCPASCRSCLKSTRFRSVWEPCCSPCAPSVPTPSRSGRERCARPRLIQTGVLLGCIICFIGLIPAGPEAMWMLTALVLVLGVGVALVHPEGLRAVCAIDGSAIPSSVATSVFMLSGAEAGISALTTSFLVCRLHVIKCILWEIAAGLPFLIWDLCAAGNSSAVVLLFLAGALVGAGFPQLVVLARTAPDGPALGPRMGLIVGGTWGVAGLLLLGGRRCS